MKTTTSKINLEMVIWPNKNLKIPVGPFDEKSLNTKLVRNTAGAMIKTMYKYYGIGLAAQQVGIPFQIFVMDPNWTKPNTKKKARIFLNPKIVDVGERTQQLNPPGEGCLSFPYNYRQPIKRFDKVELEWLDFNGNVHHEWFSDYEAIIVQHEMDHLLGHCFIDRLSPLKRDIAIRKARKIRRQYKKGYKRTISKLKNAPRTKEYALKVAKAFEEGLRSKKTTAENNNENNGST